MADRYVDAFYEPTDSAGVQSVKTPVLVDLDLLGISDIANRTASYVTAGSSIPDYLRVAHVVGISGISYGLTLPAPAAPGIDLIIDMVSPNSGTVTIALTNVVGGTQSTTAKFSAANQALILRSATNKWVVIKEQGVTLV